MRLCKSTVVLALLTTFSLGVARVTGDEPEPRFDVAHVKVGQTYKFKLTAQNTSVWEVTDKTADEVLYRIHLTVAGKELPASDVQHFALKKPKPGLPAPKKLADETLEVSGLKFPCEVFETETGGVTVKTWKSSLFPEWIKTQMGKDVTHELVEVAPAK